MSLGGGDEAKMSDDPIPAVSEADARGDVHRLFEDIRQVLGVPVVNLIFRHLATLPGCLGWSWGVLRPLYASGQVAEAADRLGTSLPLPTVGPGSRESLRRDGVDAGGERAIGRILDSYNRSNAMNLVALTGLLDWLRSGAASGQAVADALTGWIAGNPLSCKTHGRDARSRVLATCTVRGENLQSWLVSQGYVLAHRQSSTAYAAAEDKAREEKIGIWAGEFVPPSDWRKGLRLDGETPAKTMSEAKVAAN